MKDLNKSTYGLYLPAFFCMKINAYTYGENMTDKEISLFIHEYVHFLQSFTTLYGLERINSEFSIIINMVNWMKGQENKIIEVPLSERVLKTVTLYNDKISKLTWGDTEGICRLNISKIEIEQILIDNQCQVESVIITYKDKHGEESICSFGAREIYEGMAYLIEQYITRDYEESPDHPYNTAIIVAKHIYPQLLNDYRNLLVLCDKALMSSNPGPEFIRIIRWLSQIQYIPINPDALFYFLDSNWDTYDWEHKVNQMEVFVNHVERVNANLHTLLRDENFSDYHTWLDTIFDYAIDLRKTEPMFWLDIVDNGYVKDNPYFQAILNFAGSPLIETIKHEYILVNPEGCNTECLTYFKVFNQIYEILRYGKTQCELMPWCSHSPNNVIINETCHKCPWKHQESNGELCPFKAIWQHWGLNDIEITK